MTGSRFKEQRLGQRLVSETLRAVPKQLHKLAKPVGQRLDEVTGSQWLHATGIRVQPLVTTSISFSSGALAQGLILAYDFAQQLQEIIDTSFASLDVLHKIKPADCSMWEHYIFPGICISSSPICQFTDQQLKPSGTIVAFNLYTSAYRHQYVIAAGVLRLSNFSGVESFMRRKREHEAAEGDNVEKMSTHTGESCLPPPRPATLCRNTFTLGTDALPARAIWEQHALTPGPPRSHAQPFCLRGPAGKWGGGGGIKGRSGRQGHGLRLGLSWQPSRSPHGPGAAPGAPRRRAQSPPSANRTPKPEPELGGALGVPQFPPLSAPRVPLLLLLLIHPCSPSRSASFWRPWLDTPGFAEGPAPPEMPMGPGVSGDAGKVCLYRHPVRLLWPKSKCYDYLYQEAEALLKNLPIQATISFYEDDDSEDEIEELIYENESD
ncbi:protein ripply2 [Suncus etruscus]|uniref:protein ripply2 n=1 Tax=Suncus etruscus TaxID=109475 RepID=UPI002110CB94|nr:protein ripply2 [Suncus etruscus]